MNPITERVSEKVANYGAMGAVTSPWWLPTLHDMSAWCADMLPIAGFCWLLIQVGFKIWDRYHLHKKDDE